MKRLLREMYIYLVTLTGAVGRYRRTLAKQGQLVRVICLHDVTDEVWFRLLLETLSQRYHIVSPEEFLEHEFVEDKINILLTFDDGYQSWWRTIAPLLFEYKYKALFFINSGLLDVADDTEAQTEYVREKLLLTRVRETISWDEVKMLLEEGHCLGGHTVDHANVAKLRKPKREEEILGDKERIEEECQLQLDYFAYPFGNQMAVSKAARATARAAGYTTTMTAMPGFVTKWNDDIPRLLLEEGQSMPSVVRWIEGGYDLYWQRRYGK